MMMRADSLVALLAGALLFVVGPLTKAAEPVALPLTGAPGGGIIIEKNVMVPMRDGVRLATDIYRPAAPGKYPVVLRKLAYGTEQALFVKQGQWFVERGYAYAAQDIRGKYDSEGDWHGKRDEAQDGSDTITWLGTRPWSTGKVGMIGASYGGVVQYLVMDQDNPYLAALVPAVASLTLGRDVADFDHITTYGGRESGMLNLTWLLAVDGRTSQADGMGDLNGLAWRKGREHLPLADYPRIFGREMKWWTGFALNQRYGHWEEYFQRAAQGEWSKPLDLSAWWASYPDRYRKVRVPVLHLAGWYDCCVEPMIKNFELIREYAAEPLARNNQQLIIGPWAHTLGTTKLGDFDFGAQALLDVDSTAVRWFDRWLKGENNGVDKQAPVRYFVMGENRWREASDWPIPGTRFTKFYLHSNGDARLAQGGGGLSTRSPGRQPTDRYTYDPGNPTPEMLDANGVWVVGPVDRTASEKRDDVLVYTSDALDAPMEIAGALSGIFYVATSAPSTDLFVRLLDVYPDGKAYTLTTLWTNPYRTHWAKHVERKPDGTRIIKADMWLSPTANVFGKGHRIRVEISSASAPSSRGLNVEPGTEPYATKWNVAEQTIYHDRAHPSHIVLPVIPR